MRLDRRSLLLSTSLGAGLLSLGAFALCARNTGSPVQPVPYGSSFPKLPIGMNLAGIADWEPGFPFKNLFWGARPWMTRDLSDGGPWNTEAQAAFDYDDDGYPLEVPVRVQGMAEPQTVFTLVPNVRKLGRYVLLYDGEGEIDGLLSTKVLRRDPGRIVLQMAHNPRAVEPILIKRSKRGNHIRNIRLVAEEHAYDDLTANPFLPEFLDFCRSFHCLRFMDWGKTNNSMQEHWRDRKQPTFYTMVGKSGDPDGKSRPAPTEFQQKFAGGVAYEHMIHLCNILKIDMWLCIPHRATDDYIARLARLVKTTLDSSLKVYLEFSNEIWNWQFQQAIWMLRSPVAGTLVEAKGGSPWKNPEKTEGKDHPERIGALFRRAFAIWEAEWSHESDRKRLVRVCAVQAAWADASIRTIKWCLDNGGIDAVSPAAYVGASEQAYRKWAALGPNLTPEAVIEDMHEQLKRDRKEGGLLEILAYARQHDLPYVAYEGGQHIQPDQQAEVDYNHALAAAQSHPGMYDVYTELLRLHRDLGCALLMHFNSVGRQGTRWGSWGAKPRYDTPDDRAPKMRALKDSNASKPGNLI